MGEVSKEFDHARAEAVAAALAANPPKHSPWFAQLLTLTPQQQGTRLAETIAVTDPVVSVPLMCAALADLGAGVPQGQGYFSDLRSDAAFWAETASPDELVAYGAAALRACAGRPFALTTRKALMVALWQSLPPADQRKFLAQVDPKGVFRAKAPAGA
jgi:hypothetical protein